MLSSFLDFRASQVSLSLPLLPWGVKMSCLGWYPMAQWPPGRQHTWAWEHLLTSLCCRFRLCYGQVILIVQRCCCQNTNVFLSVLWFLLGSVLNVKEMVCAVTAHIGCLAGGGAVSSQKRMPTELLQKRHGLPAEKGVVLWRKSNELPPWVPALPCCWKRSGSHTIHCGCRIGTMLWMQSEPGMAVPKLCPILS